MAMFQRSPSTDSIHRWRSDSPGGAEGRKLSFNPIEQPPPPPAERQTELDPSSQPIGAFEVSKAKRILQVGVAVIYCLFAAGVVFGFAALKPILVDQGVYRDQCTHRELEDGVWVCYGQELRLNLMFTVAAVSTNVCALPVGTILDRFGPRIAAFVGVFFLTIGTLAMAFAADLPFDAYIPGYLFLALGGPFVFISSFQLSNTFPQHSGLILALLTGAFDTSSAIFLLFRLIYEASNGTFTTKHFFLIYLVVPVFILLVQIFIMPAQSYKTIGELLQQAEETSPPTQSDSDTEITLGPNQNTQHRDSVASEITALLGSTTGEQQQKQEERKAARSGVWGALHGRTAWQQILSLWFVLITLFTVVQMLRINYFVATIRTQYAALLGSDAAARRINEVFDIALPLGGVVAVPFIGLVLDNSSTAFVLSLLVATATLIGVLGVIPEVPAAYANVVLFVLYRPLYYTAVSDYAAKVFGFATFGKVYGLIICLAGICNFAQAGLDALTHGVLNDDPVPVNVALLGVAFVVGLALVGFVWRKSMTMEREKLEEEAEGAREVLMPDASQEGQGDDDQGSRRDGYGTV